MTLILVIRILAWAALIIWGLFLLINIIRKTIPALKRNVDLRTEILQAQVKEKGLVRSVKFLEQELIDTRIYLNKHEFWNHAFDSALEHGRDPKASAVDATVALREYEREFFPKVEQDVSGNSNDFTDSGLATNDQVLDTPTLQKWSRSARGPMSV